MCFCFVCFAFQQSRTKEEEERGTKDLPEEEVRARIEEYNTQVSENGMKLVSFYLFLRFIGLRRFFISSNNKSQLSLLLLL